MEKKSLIANRTAKSSAGKAPESKVTAGKQLSSAKQIVGKRVTAPRLAANHNVSVE